MYVVTYFCSVWIELFCDIAYYLHRTSTTTVHTGSPYSSLERELTGSAIFRKRAESLTEGVSGQCT